MTLDETATLISEGLPEWQRLANLNFITGVHTTLKLGGMWGYPNTGQVFKKTEEGFELIALQQPVPVEQ